MSVIGTLESTATPNTLQIALQCFLPFLYPALYSSKRLATIHKRQLHSSAASSRPRKSVEHTFYKALARASSCQNCAKHIPSSSTSCTAWLHRPKRKDPIIRSGVRGFQSERDEEGSVNRWPPDPGEERAESAVAPPSKEELMDLVAMYATIDSKPLKRQRDTLPPPPIPTPLARERPEAFEGSPYSAQWDPLEPVHEMIGGKDGHFRTSDGLESPTPSIDFMDNQSLKDQENNSGILPDLHEFRRVLEEGRGKTSNEALFELYRRLPAPRAVYLSETEIREFLNRLMWNKKASEAILVRYLSVLDDMKTSNMEIKGREWNTAIHFAGRYTGRVYESEVESALQMWRAMELEAGVQSDTVSFNILFDLASKAGKFALADVILKEMERRELRYDRATYMALIYYHGMRGDGDGIRKTYSSMVAAGEIIDTTVINNVIMSLFRAGEPSTAEQTFFRMKRLHAEKAGATLPPHGWESSRKLQKILTQAAIKWRDNAKARSRIQDAAPFAPSTVTYRGLIEYHAYRAGNFHRTSELLDEMAEWGHQPDGFIYYWLLAGFSQHGGVRYSSWTLDRLEQIWSQFLMACDERPEETELAGGTAAMAVRAFAQCANLERAREVWEDIKMRWTPGEKTITDVHRIFVNKRESESDSLFYQNPSKSEWWQTPHE